MDAETRQKIRDQVILHRSPEWINNRWNEIWGNLNTNRIEKLKIKKEKKLGKVRR